MLNYSDNQLRGLVMLFSLCMFNILHVLSCCPVLRSWLVHIELHLTKSVLVSVCSIWVVGLMAGHKAGRRKSCGSYSFFKNSILDF